MLRVIRFAAVVILGLVAGFLVALWSTWTYAMEFNHTKVDYVVMNAPNGDILKIPVHEEQMSFSAHSEPYRTSPVVDLFNNKEATK